MTINGRSLALALLAVLVFAAQHAVAFQQELTPDEQASSESSADESSADVSSPDVPKSAETEAPVTNAADEGYPAVFFAERRPIFLRVVLRPDNQSLAVKWGQYLERTFAAVDVDQSGTLSNAEFEKIPGIARVTPMSRPGFFSQLAKVFGDGQPSRPSTSADSAMALEEFVSRIEQQKSAVTLQRTAHALGDTRSSEWLWRLVDQDGDDAWSMDDVAAIPDRFSRYDADSNGLLSVSELGQFRNPLAGQAQDASVMPASLETSELMLLTSRAHAVHAVEQLLSKYYDRQQNALAPRETRPNDMQLAPEVFNAADSSKDGAISTDEWLSFLLAPKAEFEITVDLTTAPVSQASPAVAPSPSVGNKLAWTHHPQFGCGDVSITSSNENAVVLLAGGSKIQIATNSLNADAEALYMQQFPSADADGNGYIDFDESQRHGFFAGTFRQMDLDGDGKLFREELAVYVERIEDEHASRAEIRLQSLGRHVFTLLDQNNDLRLSPREMRAAAEQLAAWDLDGDQVISRDEIPEAYNVIVTQGSSMLRYNIDQSVAAMTSAAQGVSVSDAPQWFVALDRNRDGDVSPREFPGPVELFQRMDQNRDGFIDADEARAEQISEQQP